MRGAITAVTTTASTLVVDEAATIQWMPGGAVGNVEIYTKKGTNSWVRIPETFNAGVGVAGSLVDGGGGAKEWTWLTVDDHISDSVLFRVEKASNANVKGESGAKAIKGQLTVAEPNAGHVYYIGDTILVKWNKTGTLGTTLEIEYSPTGAFAGEETSLATLVDPGVDGENIFGSTWTVDASLAVSDGYIVRIKTETLPAAISLEDDSNAAFQIRPKIISISSPASNSSSVWYVGETTKTINWTASTGQKTDASDPEVSIWYGQTGSWTLLADPGSTGVASLNSSSNSYTWPLISDENDETLQIQITYDDYPLDEKYVSTQTFAIRPAIKFENITEDTRMDAFSDNNLIQWSHTGSAAKVGNVHVAYNYNLGGGWVDITSGGGVPVEDGAAGIDWDNLSDINGNVTLRVQAIGNTNVEKISDGFKIVGGLTLKAPIDGVVWFSKVTNQVTWDFSGTIASVNVYYDADGVGGTFDFVKQPGSKAQSGDTGTNITYDWIPDGTVRNGAMIKITDASNETDTVSIGTTGFNIAATFGTIDPDGDEDAYAEETYLVKWQTNGILGVNDVGVYHDNGSGSGWVEVEPGVVKGFSGGQYSWTVPGAVNDLQNTNRIKITQQDPAGHENETEVFSTNVFNILGAITVTKPDNNSEWLVNTTETIKFTMKGALQTVDFFYSATGAAPWGTALNGGTAVTISSLPESGGEYSWNWQIPIDETLTVAKAGKIRIAVVAPAAQATESVEGIQENGFQLKGSITNVKLKDDVTTMVVGDPITIQWTPSGDITLFKIHYKKGTDSWTVIPATSGGIAGSDAGSGVREWQWNPVIDIISNNVLLKVEDHYNTNVSKETTATITVKGKLTVDAPNVTTAYYIGDTIPIRWNKTGSIGSLTIEYSPKGDFSDIQTIAASGVASGSDGVNTYGVTWFAPNTVSEAYKIRIRNDHVVNSPPVGTELTDDSDAPFGVRPKFNSIVSPTGASKWFIGDTFRVITWSTTSGLKTDDSNPKVKIEYNLDGGSYNLLDDPGSGALDSPDGTNNYTWSVIPNVKSSSATVKLTYTDYGENIVKIVSAPPFKLHPQITIGDVTADTNYSLDGIDGLQAGTLYTNVVKWAVTGSTISFVKIYYDDDESGTFAGVIDDTGNVAVGDGIAGINWSVSNAIKFTTNAKIKVADSDDLLVFGVTPAGEVFKTRGGLTLTAPVDGKVWIAQTTQNITWDYKGTTEWNINIYYDPDSTAYSWGDPIDTVSATGGSYTWLVPTTVTNKGVIRIAAQTDSLVEDIGTDFKVMAAFDVTAPEKGTGVMLTDGDYTITWDTPNGTGISAVRLYYTNDGDQVSPTWIPIDIVSGNPGEYDWSPPAMAYDDLKSTKHKVRVTQQDPLNEDTTDPVLNLLKDSESYFTIEGGLWFTSPTSNQSWGVNQTKTITFDKIGEIREVSVAYSPDGSAGEYDNNELGTVDTSGAGPYSFPWYIDPATPLTAGFVGKLRLKATDPTPPIVERVLTVSLEIKGTVELLKPGGTLHSGDPQIVLPVNGTYTIQWSTSGAIDAVEVHYSETGGIESGGTYPGDNLITTKNVSSGSTFGWDVPDAIGTGVRIRVRDSNNENVWDESDYNFRIKGNLVVDLPTATNIVWYVGETHRTINWTSTGSFSPLDVHFSTNGGTAGGGDYIHPTDFIVGATNCTPGGDNTCTGSTPWAPIPDRIGSLVRVRVRGQETESDVEAESGNNFKILGKLDVTSPESASDIWLIGETFRRINWNSSGTVTNVMIGYKTSPAGDCTFFETNHGGHIKGANFYDWTTGVANARTETAYICLADVDYPNANETLIYSDSPFKIRPKITVTAPVGGTRLVVESDNANLIKWAVTGTQTTQVEIRYSLDGGTDGYPVSQQIATNIPVANGTAGIAWDNIPDSISDDVTLKVFDVHANLVSGESAASFKIVGDVFNVQVRNSTDSQDETALKFGGEYLIKWSTTGTFTPEDKIQIKYTMYGEAAEPTYPLTVIASTARGDGNGSDSWASVPYPLSNETLGQKVIIRVADYNDAETCDYSADLKIQSVLDVTQPEDANIIIASGTQDYQIKWNVTGWEDGDQALIQYRVGAGDWTEAESNSTQPYDTVSGANIFLWDVPTTQSVISKIVRVRVLDNGDQTNINQSEQLFEIRAGLDVTSPVGNANPDNAEKWLVGSTHKITWTLVGYMDTVKMQFSVNGSAFADIPAAGQQVPPTNIPADEGDPDIDPDFGWVWTIPDSISTQVKIRVVNEDDPDNVYATSPEHFNIIGQIDFNPTLPQGGDSIWYVGETKEIGWTTIGDIPAVNLQYFVNATDGWVDITGAHDLTSSPYTWTVDDLIDPDISVRAINAVLDGSKPTTPAVSGDIEVKGQLTIDSPVLNDIWQVDNTYEILWTPTGTMDTVKLEYSTNGFAGGETYDVLGPDDASAADLTAGNNGEQQSFVWELDKTDVVISHTVTVRATDNDDGDVTGDSELMKIAGRFKVLTPNGGTYYEVDRTETIQWETHGAITNALLQYSTNGFNNETEVVDIITVSAGSDGGTYAWKIPPVDDEEVRVRIVDPDSAYVPATQTCSPIGSDTCTVSDKSDANFEIRPELEFLEANSDVPVISEVWLIDETHEIQFTKHGTISTVKIEFQVDGGGYDGNFIRNPVGTQATNVSGDTFVWRIPDEKGLNNVQLRVTDLNDPNVTIESCTFTIRGGFTWINPAATDQVLFVETTTPVTVPAEVLSWTAFGTIPTIDLKYSVAGPGGPFNFMQTQTEVDADDIPNCIPQAPSLNCTSTFNWDVPNQVSKIVYVRIQDSSDIDAVKTFGPIKIAGKIYIDEPDNDPQIERWGIGTDQVIDWLMGGTISSLKIEYSLDNGGTWVDPPIDSGIVGTTFTKTWSIGGSVPAVSQAMIRITDVDTDSGTPEVRSPAFKIVGSFTVGVPTQTDNLGSPQGTLVVVENGEITFPGDPAAVPDATISWTTAGNVAEVNVLYSTTGDTGDWTQINDAGSPIADGGDGGSISWEVPDEITTTMRIRVRDEADQDTFNDSSLFTVRAGLKLTSPVGGEKWGVSGSDQGHFKSITWQRNGSMADVYLDYDAGSGWLPIKNAIGGYAHENDGMNGIFAWDVPPNLSTNAKVRIRNVPGLGLPEIEYISPAGFKIMARFEVTQPTGGEIASAGQEYEITWDYWGTVTNAEIDLATDAVSAQVCGPSYTYDKDVTTPTITASLRSTGNSWVVNPAWVDPIVCIRIYDTTDLDTVTYSPAPFVIRSDFAFLGMSDDMDIEVGAPYTLRWSRPGDIPTTVEVQYSPSGLSGGGNLQGTIWDIDGASNGIVDNNETDCSGTDPYKGCYVWTPPDVDDTEDENLYLRIRDLSDTGGFIISPAFNLVPKFTVTSPNGNSDADLTDRWDVGTEYEITWTSSSSITKTPLVDIIYSLNGGATFPEENTIARTDNDLSYIWGEGSGGVPNLIDPDVKIRVIDASASGPLALDDSDHNFRIISDFTLSIPNTATTYEVDDTIAITWTNTGSPVDNVQLLYSTDSDNDNPTLWTDFLNPVEIENSIGNSSPYISWSVPDDISTTVRVLVRSTTDDGFDISDVEFRIRGKLLITAPVFEEPVAIGQDYMIKWNTTGTIPNVDIVYDTNDGNDNYPLAIMGAPDPDNFPGVNVEATNVPNNGKFLWKNVPDTPTNLAKIKIVDSRSGESDVLDESFKFNIIGNFTIVSPNDGEDWRVNSTHNITWTWGGTIPEVTLWYALDGTQASPTWWQIDTTLDYSGDGKQQDGDNNNIQRSYLWTVPDDISPTVKVKIEDAYDNTVLDDSDAIFKIRGDFVVTSPNGDSDVDSTDRWVTHDTKIITWDTDGTIDNVYLSYSDSGVHYFPCADASTTCDKGDALTVPNTGANKGNYSWVVPDAVKKVSGEYDDYNLVKIRVEDSNDDEVFDESDNDFKIDYYQVTWEVFDLLTNAALSDLAVTEVDSTDPSFILWQEVGITTASPRVQPTPYGSWLATWSKTGYGDMGQLVVADQDQSYQLYMETSTVHIWRAVSNFAYDPDTNTLDVISFLERDGSVISGTVRLDVKFYEGSALIHTLTAIAASEPEKFTDEGLIIQQWPATTLQAGKVYAVVSSAEIGTGGVFNSPTSLTITETKKLDDLETTINTKLDKSLSEVEGAISLIIQTKMDDQLKAIQSKMDVQTGKIDTALTNFTSSVADSIISLEEAASDSLYSASVLEDAADLSKAAALDLQDIARRQSAKLLLPQSAITGEPVKLRYRGYTTGLIPLIDILDFENKPLVQATPMPEIPDKPALYEYIIEEIDSAIYEPGTSFTVIVTESFTGSIESGAVYVETAGGQLLMPRTVLLGDKVIIQFRGREDWKPVITLINFENEDVVKDAKMDRVKDIDGMFEYTIDNVRADIYVPGKPVTVTVTEPTTATVESGTFIVEATSLTSLEGLVAAGAGVKDVAQDALDAINAVKGTLATGGDVSMALERIKLKINRLPRKIAEEGITDPLVRAVDDIRDQFTQFAGDEGYDFSTLFEIGLEASPTIGGIRTTTDKVQGATEVMQKVIEQKLGGEDAPVVHSFFH